MLKPNSKKTYISTDEANYLFANPDILTKLYQAHFDLNEIYVDNKRTLFEFAILKDKPKIFETLIQLVIDINYRSQHIELTPLNYAAINGKPYYLERLVKLGADVNTVDVFGYTPLHSAIHFNQHENIEYLLTAPDLDVNIASSNYRLPLDTAIRHNNYDAITKIIYHPQYDPLFNQLIVDTYGGYYTLISKFNDLRDIDKTTLEAYRFAKIFGHKFDFNGCIPMTKIDSHKLPCYDFGNYMYQLIIPELIHSFSSFYENMSMSHALPNWFITSYVESMGSLNDFRIDPAYYYNKILEGDSVILPSGWIDHSVGIVIHKNRLYRCNRAVGNDIESGIEEFIITKPENISVKLISDIYDSYGSPKFILEDIVEILGLYKTGIIPHSPQIAPNCTWSSLSLSMEAAILSNLLEQGVDNDTAHKIAEGIFSSWVQFDLSNTLKEVILQKDVLSNLEIYDDLLIKAIQRYHNPVDIHDVQMGIAILNELETPIVLEHFDREIGDNILKYHPTAYEEISYLKHLEPSTLQYYFDMFFGSKNDMLSETNLDETKNYFEYLKAVDDYRINTFPTLGVNDVLELSIQDSINGLFDKINLSEASIYNPLKIEILPPLTMQMHSGTDII